VTSMDSTGLSRVGLSTSMRLAGAVRLADGSTRFCVWAPSARQVRLRLEDAKGVLTPSFLMDRPSQDETLVSGYHEITLPDIATGQRYRFHLDGGDPRPDPCSLWQPDGPAGPSAVYAPEDFNWTDQQWRGVARGDLVLYELHIGTFTPAGTFEAAIDRLNDLVELGVTAIEIMPVGQFPGDRNWGYDGTLIYAAQNSYGGPAGLQKLVDAAHARGIAVILDVVYNHLGPEHCYVREFGPYFTDKYKTPWGSAINYDDRHCDPVRAWVLDNARMWLEEFHLDGLRLDAVHAIFDLGAKHILREIAELADEVQARQSRHTHVIAESDLNDPRLLLNPERGGFALDAQWSDDFHHAIHALLTNESRGYYVDYGEAKHVASVLQSPFLGAGEFSRHRGRRHGAPPIGIPGDRFVVCIQNHDQVGNRAIGDRLSAIVRNWPDGPARLRLAASVLLLAPHLPMLFMGEEYGEPRPFPFFCSFDGKDLIEAVREGRRREFRDFIDASHDVPDPLTCSTFESAKLTWDWSQVDAAQLRRLYKELLQGRRTWPAMRDFITRDVRLWDGADVIQYMRGTVSPLTIFINLSARSHRIDFDGSYDILFSSEDVRYGGPRTERGMSELLPFECVVLGRASL
jgi:maltooligosyltrehalose trehalohydrolase